MLTFDPKDFFEVFGSSYRKVLRAQRVETPNVRFACIENYCLKIRYIRRTCSYQIPFVGARNTSVQ